MNYEHFISIFDSLTALLKFSCGDPDTHSPQQQLRGSVPSSRHILRVVHIGALREIPRKTCRRNRPQVID